MCIILPKALQKLSADGANNNNGNRQSKHPTAMGSITVPRFPKVIFISQNVRGYSSELSSSKKDHIVRILDMTHSATHQPFYSPKKCGQITTWTWQLTTHSSSPMAPSPTPAPREASESVQAWKLAGQPDPICPGKIAGATRIMVLELHFRDNADKMNKLFVISTYLPCSSYTNNKYEATLAELVKQTPKKTSSTASSWPPWEPP
jgi:hypothetical protein